MDSTHFCESIDTKITKIGVVVKKILNFKDWMNFCLKTEKQKRIKETGEEGNAGDAV